MTKEQLNAQYFEWMYDILCPQESRKSYRLLLSTLHDIQFTYDIPMDTNRAEDGISLRYIFGDEYDVDYPVIAAFLDDKPCSVLEMMAALAMRYEEHIMCDDKYGDRTHVWFWTMIENLGLSDMSDDHYKPREVEAAVTRMMKHQYERDGKGGLFYIPNCLVDLRKTEIWYQGCWYLSAIVDEQGDWI